MKNEINATLKIPMQSEEQVKHLQKARNNLTKAGITFDSGYDLVNGIFEWKLDWSLKGAKILKNLNYMGIMFKVVLLFDITAVDEKKALLFKAEEELWQSHVLFTYSTSARFIDDIHNPFWDHRIWRLDKIKNAELVIRK